jgi:hypothetical protein
MIIWHIEFSARFINILLSSKSKTVATLKKTSIQSLDQTVAPADSDTEHFPPTPQKLPF